MNVQQIARLAKLRLSPEEEARMEAEFAEMLVFARSMGDAAGADAPAPVGRVRLDEPAPCLDRETILAASPASDAGCIVVPKTL